MPVRSLCLALILAIAGRAEEAPLAPRDLPDLQHRIEQVLKANNTPGACVVLTGRDRTLWVAGLGQRDVAKGLAVTPDTPFRIGSISKMFAGLAALKLASEGRLDLQAPLRALAPEIPCENPWEDQHPVRVVHLLEHTSGWDDWRLREYADNDPRPRTLKEGLDFDPRSRRSRWQPGTLVSYCNSGPAVVAYLVQKITGEDFEQYVAENFFHPLGMDTASFRPTPGLTQLYHRDGRTPRPYSHLLMRPAGALNASAQEMGSFLRLLLNRGMVEGRMIIPAASLDRMETPTSSLAAQAGLPTGYGLHNYSSLDDRGFLWHGHDGGLEGGLSRLYYLPEAGVGYFFSMNSDRTEAYRAIQKLLRAYLTKDLPRPPFPAVPALAPAVAAAYTGWYLPCSPRRKDMAFLDVLAVTRLHFQEGKLLLSPALGSARTFVPVTERQFRLAKDPLATMVLLPAGPEGLRFQEGWDASRRIPAPLAWVILAMAALLLTAFLSSVLFALVWVPRLAFRRMKAVRHLSLRAWPLAASLTLLAVVLMFSLDQNPLTHLGTLSAVSLGFCLLTVFFAFASGMGLVQAQRTPRAEVNLGVWIQALLASGAFTVLAIFLAWQGVVGIRTWR